MSFSPEKIAYLSARTLVRRFFESGVENFVISPGYRNSPLVLALAKMEGVKLHSHIDERGAAFFALGLAKATKKPAAVLCTSGTAAANYLPAVLEAFYSHIPLVVVTADRPQELLGVGANQAMDQTKIFGSHTRFFTSIPALQTLNRVGLENIQLLAAKSVALSEGPVPGPVHLNIAFREPFFLKSAEIDAVEREAENLSPSQLEFFSTATVPTEEEMKRLQSLLFSKERILLAVGPAELSQEECSTLLSLAKKLHAPIFAEMGSGLGFATGAAQSTCSRFEILMRDEAFVKSQRPDLILRYGPPLTSKLWGDYQVSTGAPLLVIDQTTETRNPQYGETYYCTGKPETILSKLEKSLQPRETSQAKEWCNSLLEKNQQCEERIQNYLANENAFTEWHVHREIAQKLPPNSLLFISNSMPIRDFDAVGKVAEKNIQVFANRGLSGIDGIFSTAIGVAVGSKKIVTLVIGDLSALHDINALSLAKRMAGSIRLNILVINNNGGEIFRMVPTGESLDAEKFFTTPQGLDFSQLSAGFGIPYQRWDSLTKFREKISEFYEVPGVKIVELTPNASRNTSIRKEFWKSLKQ